MYPSLAPVTAAALVAVGVGLWAGRQAAAPVAPAVSLLGEVTLAGSYQRLGEERR